MSIAGIVLAGGAGARMQNEDKGLVALDGKPLVQHVIERFSPQVDTLIVSANRNLNSYQQFSDIVLKDVGDEHRYQGPMAGISACLKHLLSTNSNEADWALVTPCDTPFIPRNFGQTLLSNCSENHSFLAVAFADGRRQILHTLIHRSLWNNLIDSYEGGERAMKRWFETQKPDYVHFDKLAEPTELDGLSSFENINQIRSLEKINQRLQDN